MSASRSSAKQNSSNSRASATHEATEFSEYLHNAEMICCDCLNELQNNIRIYLKNIMNYFEVEEKKAKMLRRAFQTEFSQSRKSESSTSRGSNAVSKSTEIFAKSYIAVVEKILKSDETYIAKIEAHVKDLKSIADNCEVERKRITCDMSRRKNQMIINLKELEGARRHYFKSTSDYQSSDKTYHRIYDDIHATKKQLNDAEEAMKQKELVMNSAFKSYQQILETFNDKFRPSLISEVDNLIESLHQFYIERIADYLTSVNSFKEITFEYGNEIVSVKGMMTDNEKVLNSGNDWNIVNECFKNKVFAPGPKDFISCTASDNVSIGSSSVESETQEVSQIQQKHSGGSFDKCEKKKKTSLMRAILLPKNKSKNEDQVSPTKTSSAINFSEKDTAQKASFTGGNTVSEISKGPFLNTADFESQPFSKMEKIISEMDKFMNIKSTELIGVSKLLRSTPDIDNNDPVIEYYNKTRLLYKECSEEFDRVFNIFLKKGGSPSASTWRANEFILDAPDNFCFDDEEEDDDMFDRETQSVNCAPKVSSEQINSKINTKATNEFCTVLYDYSAQTQDEFSIKTGQKYIYISDHDENWILAADVSCPSIHKFIPKSYVKID